MDVRTPLTLSCEWNLDMLVVFLKALTPQNPFGRLLFHHPPTIRRVHPSGFPALLLMESHDIAFYINADPPGQLWLGDLR